MSDRKKQVRVLYSFPNRLGADRICYTAWQQVNGLAAAGADLLIFPGSLSRPVPDGVRVRPTLARGNLRLPYRLLGPLRTVALHDWIVSRQIEELGGQIDIIHTWPLGALETLKTACPARNPDGVRETQCAHGFCHGGSEKGVRTPWVRPFRPIMNTPTMPASCIGRKKSIGWLIACFAHANS